MPVRAAEGSLASNAVTVIARRRKNILVTGPPGVGKTTLIMNVARRLSDLQPAGFYTREIREGGTRKGFELMSFSGRRGILAHVENKGPLRVSKYGVDLNGFDAFLRSLAISDPLPRLIIIDEIGKMECLSSPFRTLIERILDADTVLVATIAMKGGGLIEKIKKRNDIVLYHVTTENRDTLPEEIAKIVSQYHSSKPPAR